MLSEKCDTDNWLILSPQQRLESARQAVVVSQVAGSPKVRVSELHKGIRTSLDILAVVTILAIYHVSLHTSDEALRFFWPTVASPFATIFLTGRGRAGLTSPGSKTSSGRFVLEFLGQ